MKNKQLASGLLSAHTAAVLPFKVAAGAFAAACETALTGAPAYAHRPRLELVVRSHARRQTRNGADAPVVLVPGYLSPHASWEPLLRKLHLSGFRNIVCLRYNAFKVDIPGIASALCAEVRQAVRRSDSDGAHLIGYSLGGLGVRYAVQQLGLEDSTLTATTIATPHRGTPLAHLGVGAAVRQLRSNSRLLSTLPDIDSGQGVRWHLIASPSDAVVPFSSATAGHHVSSSSVPGCGHLNIMNSPHMADVVVRHLHSATSTEPWAEDAA